MRPVGEMSVVALGVVARATGLLWAGRTPLVQLDSHSPSSLLHLLLWKHSSSVWHLLGRSSASPGGVSIEHANVGKLEIVLTAPNLRVLLATPILVNVLQKLLYKWQINESRIVDAVLFSPVAIVLRSGTLNFGIKLFCHIMPPFCGPFSLPRTTKNSTGYKN